MWVFDSMELFPYRITHSKKEGHCKADRLTSTNKFDQVEIV